MLNVQLDVSQVTSMLTGLERAVMPKATASTLNKVARKAQAVAVKRIAKDIGIKQMEVRKYLRIQKATWRNLRISVKSRGKRVPISKLSARQTKKGVTYRSQGKRKLIPGAFIADVRVKGSPDVYKRQGKARFPLERLRAVSIPHVMIKAAIDRALWEVSRETWDKNFPHEVEHYLRRAGFVR